MTDVTPRKLPTRLIQSFKKPEEIRQDIKKFFEAIHDGNLKTLDALMDEYPKDWTTWTRWNGAFEEGPVLYAAKHAALPTLEFLLKNGANPNERLNDYTPLTNIADEHGKAKQIELILAYHGDPNMRDKYDRTPLDVAVSKFKEENIFLLIVCGADTTGVKSFDKDTQQVIDAAIAALNAPAEDADSSATSKNTIKSTPRTVIVPRQFNKGV